MSEKRNASPRITGQAEQRLAAYRQADAELARDVLRQAQALATGAGRPVVRDTDLVEALLAIGRQEEPR